MSVRRRRADDLPGCVRALEVVHVVDRYPMRWPADPVGWLSPHGLTAAWVAEREGAVVGHVCVVAGTTYPGAAARAGLLPHLSCSASHLFVAPPGRGRGLAAELLHVASSFALAEGLELVLDVVEDGGPAVALYERLGWRLVQRRTADWTTPEGDRLPVRVYLAPQGGPPARS